MVGVLSTLIAMVLLVVPVVSLRLVSNDSIRLAMIVAFTVAFAASVPVTTTARRAEHFAATAAMPPCWWSL